MTNTNIHQPHPCPYCWLVLYSKSALTGHLNREHWQDLEAEVKVEVAEVELAE